MLRPHRLDKLLGTRFCGHHLLQLCVVDSTNRVLLDWARRALPAGTTLVATRQQAGKGQRGRDWLSLPGGLYLSLLLYPQATPAQILELTLALAWGVVARLRSVVGSVVQIKWPNDIVADGRKLGGILLEARLSGSEVAAVVAGLGLNVHNPVPETGITLASLREEETDLTQVAAWALQGLEQGYLTWQTAGLAPIVPDYEDWMWHRHSQIPLPDATAATVMGVATTGALRVQTPVGDLHWLLPEAVRLGYPRPSGGES